MTATNENKQVLLEVTIAAPVDAVWRALREPEQLKSWFGWDADTLDEEIDLIFQHPDDVDDAARTIRFGTWEGIADGFELEVRDGRTVLRVVRFGAPPTSWDDVYDDVREGWFTFVHQLRLLLERHPGETRRTLFLAGAPRADRDVFAAVSVAPLRALPAGAPYEAALPTDEVVNGEVWHKSGHQLGLRVTAWGEGLLVLAHKPAALKPPRGTANVNITTFGLDDDAFAALERRWSAWWLAHFEPTP
ncbi:MAG: SRPBCC domain-containing protein [Myxococcales bacterium]|nr:SRPBCC domain-containing protein [Myxococcales bacterium]MCB9652090.1 SRPBCC domain-containing protein [Deltaproteobacteria bacterium]